MDYMWEHFLFFQEFNLNPFRERSKFFLSNILSNSSFLEVFEKFWTFDYLMMNRVAKGGVQVWRIESLKFFVSVK